MFPAWRKTIRVTPWQRVGRTHAIGLTLVQSRGFSQPQAVTLPFKACPWCHQKFPGWQQARLGVLENASCRLLTRSNFVRYFNIKLSRQNDQKTKAVPVAGKSCPYSQCSWNRFKWWLSTAVFLFIDLFSNVFSMYFSPFGADPKNMHEEDARMTCWWWFSERLVCGRLSWDAGFAPQSVKLSPLLWACWQFFS